MIRRILHRLAPVPPDVSEAATSDVRQQDEAEKALKVLDKYTKANRRKLAAVESERRLLQQGRR